MTLGNRIRSRLSELGMTQSELSRRAQIPQTTVNGLILGKSRTTPHLLRLAHELQTTAAYLTGETDDPHSELPEFVISGEERALISMLRSLRPKDKAAVRRIVTSLRQQSR